MLGVCQWNKDKNMKDLQLNEVVRCSLIRKDLKKIRCERCLGEELHVEERTSAEALRQECTWCMCIGNSVARAE